MAVSTFTKSGAKATTAAKLDKAVFGVDINNSDLLHRAYVAYMANGRTNNARVKTRGEVRGGGRKPWRQKGTGRARFGSIRVPIWRGGGITFGPTGEENHSKKLTKATMRVAIRQALTAKSNAKAISVIETFECKNGKVKDTIKLLDKIGATGKVLIVVEVKDELTIRATKNLQNTTVVQAKYLNVYDVLNADSIVISKKALEMVHEWLGGDK